MISARCLSFILGVFGSATWAQQISGIPLYQESSGLSASCKEALKTKIDCNRLLPVLSQRSRLLDKEGFDAICTDKCHRSLQSASRIIKNACKASADKIIYDDEQQVASYPVDSLSFTYDVSCHKDSKTGAPCDPQLLSWPDPSQKNQSSGDKYCSDCWLGVQQLQLSNPLGYDDYLATELASLTKSCKATGYGVTFPTSYGAMASGTGFATPTGAGGWNASATDPAPGPTSMTSSGCKSSYMVKPFDTCNSVAKAHNVSTYDLINANHLDIYCASFPSVLGKVLCIPDKCDTYTWQASDSCDSIVKQYSKISRTQFLSWNPLFNALCQNAINFSGYQVCISPPGGFLASQSHASGSGNDLSEGPGSGKSEGGNYTNKNIIETVASAVSKPSNGLDGLNQPCAEWYTIATGDTCYKITIDNHISMSALRILNPSLKQDCSNLLVGLAYCVKGTSSGPSPSNAGSIATGMSPSASQGNTAIQMNMLGKGTTATVSSAEPMVTNHMAKWRRHSQ